MTCFIIIHHFEMRRLREVKELAKSHKPRGQRRQKPEPVLMFSAPQYIPISLLKCEVLFTLIYSAALAWCKQSVTSHFMWLLERYHTCTKNFQVEQTLEWYWRNGLTSPWEFFNITFTSSPVPHEFWFFQMRSVGGLAVTPAFAAQI